MEGPHAHLGAAAATQRGHEVEAGRGRRWRSWCGRSWLAPCRCCGHGGCGCGLLLLGGRCGVGLADCSQAQPAADLAGAGIRGTCRRRQVAGGLLRGRGGRRGCRWGRLGRRRGGCCCGCRCMCWCSRARARCLGPQHFSHRSAGGGCCGGGRCHIARSARVGGCWRRRHRCSGLRWGGAERHFLLRCCTERHLGLSCRLLGRTRGAEGAASTAAAEAPATAAATPAAAAAEAAAAAAARAEATAAARAEAAAGLGALSRLCLPVFDFTCLSL